MQVQTEKSSILSGISGWGRKEWAGLFFRAARLLFLALVIIMPWEAITAAREMAMLGGAAFMAAHLYLDPDRRLRPTALFWPLGFYLLVAALSLVWAVDFSYSLRELRAEVVKGILVYYTAAHVVSHEEHLAQVWGALLIGAALMGLFGLVYFYKFGGSLLHHQVRAGSLHNGYGGFGTYLAAVWPLVLLAPRAFGRGRLRPWLWGLTGLTAVVAFLTYNRASWLGIMAGTLVCLLLIFKNRLKAFAVGLGLCAVLAAGLFLMPGAHHGEHWDKLVKSPEEMGGTAGDLFALWEHSWREVKKDPFRGIGLGRHSFSKAYQEFRETHQPLLWHAHNMFVDITLQMGLQGLAAILLILVVLAACLWPNSPPPSGDMAGLFRGGAVAMLVGFSVRNLTDDFFADDSALLFWLLAGLAMGVREWRREAN